MKYLAIAFLFLISYHADARDTTFYFKTSDNVQLFVRIAGKGTPCLFVHGGPGSTSYYFEAMPSAKRLEQSMQMIYFDQRGSGRSASAANGDYSLTRFEQDIEELRRHLQIKRWIVMGHSFAGIIVTNYAYHQPLVVEKLALVNCTLNMPYSMNSHIAFAIKECNIGDRTPFYDTSKPMIERVGMAHQRLTEKGTWYKLMFASKHAKDYSDSITLSVDNFNFNFQQHVWDIADYMKDYTTLTPAIKCPVLIVRGTRDFAIGVDHYKSFRFPNPKIVSFNGGHAPFQEAPIWFAQQVLQFIKG